eukprot:GHVL01015155.1.p2 GENE.GHVL01015155.1~~GHVL01015155.1.p2  ORF type:complete len:648 (+),score=156.09 GHVL01015155.1:133-2076(+)
MATIDSAENVRVCVRIRPHPQSDKNLVRVENDCVILRDPRHKGVDKAYPFDRIYQENDSTEVIFKEQVEHSLSQLFDLGLSSTFFAYGCSGTGKTHTMHGNDTQNGIVQYSVEHLFQLKLLKPDEDNFKIVLSFFEIYQDKVRDLLSVVSSEGVTPDLPMRENSDGRVVVAGLTEMPITSVEEFKKHYDCGLLKRTVHGTGMNAVSSRGHGCVQLRVVRHVEEEARRTSRRANASSMTFHKSTKQQVGVLSLIDLSGNEDNRKTGNKGVRLQESAAINSSLFALSKVIDALKNKAKRVPYRESKLTRLLKDSLGGHNHAVMICTMSPAEHLFQQTYATLGCAVSSKNIKNVPSQGWIGEGANNPWAVNPTRLNPSKRSPPTKDNTRKRGRNASGCDQDEDEEVVDRSIRSKRRAAATTDLGRGRKPVSVGAALTKPPQRKAPIRRVEKQNEENMIKLFENFQKQMSPIIRQKCTAIFAEMMKEYINNSSLMSLECLTDKTVTDMKFDKNNIFTEKSVTDINFDKNIINYETEDMQEKDIQVTSDSEINVETDETDKESCIESDITDDSNKENDNAELAIVENDKNELLSKINEGTLDSLRGLKVIGEKRAVAILSHRSFFGNFQNLDDLKAVDMKGFNYDKFLLENC